MRPALRSLVLTTALVAAAAFGGPGRLQAQDSAAATLVADQLQISAGSRLIARGNVEVVHKGAVLRAREVTYDRDTGALQINGPITLTEPGGAVLLAEEAELSADMRNGLLRSARLVMDRQLQLAAQELRRVEGRHTVMTQAVTSSCQVCVQQPVPLWEIRAKRIVHDQLERQIYFDQASLRMMGVPVAWVPRLRLPDPSLKRARGVLTPRLVSNSRLGFGLEVPYFIPLGESRDVTLTPLLATKDVRSLGLRYREAFVGGELALTGAISHDDTQTSRRGWLSAEGRFDMPRDFELRFSAMMISDPAYLRDYDLSDQDRLHSTLSLGRVRRDELIEAGLRHVHSIREGEINSQMPQMMADFTWTRRVPMSGIGGVATFSFNAHGHRRTSDEDILGRDVSQARLAALWRRDWLLQGGLVGALEAGTAFELNRIGQDSRYPTRITTATPMVSAELRWPWARVLANGTSDVIEPVVQLVWSRLHSGQQVPNSDSELVEFDEGNLFGFSRFPGSDRREGGTRLNTGISWTRVTQGGTTVIANAGRVFRFSGYEQFSPVTGLNGKRSSWVTSLHLQSAEGLAFQGRAIFDDSFDLSRGELRMGLDRARYGLTASWIWADADETLSTRQNEISEWSVDGRVKLSRNWNARATGRYDFGTNQTTSAGLGLQYLNECLRFDVALQRRFSGTDAIRPTTNLSLSMDLLGFGGTSAPGRAGGGSCSF